MPMTNTGRKARWRNLTDEQRDRFGNGCGPYRAWIRPPDLVFSVSCRQHDFYYTRGGWLIAKLWADIQFGWAMQRNAWGQKRFPHRVMYSAAGLVYVAAVLLAGWTSFHWGRWRTKDEILAIDAAAKEQ